MYSRGRLEKVEQREEKRWKKKRKSIVLFNQQYFLIPFTCLSHSKLPNQLSYR